jgi:hypothetical protein
VVVAAWVEWATWASKPKASPTAIIQRPPPGGLSFWRMIQRFATYDDADSLC